MKVSCQACGAKYTIADDKVRGRKVKIRCKSCGSPIVVDAQNPGAEVEGAPAAAAVAAVSTPEAAGSPAAAAPAANAVAAAAAPDGQTWSVNLSDTEQRDMTTAEIVEGWKSGAVTHDAFVWKDGMGDWLPILDSPELGPLLSPAPAPVLTGTETPFGPTIVTGETAPKVPAAARLSGGGRKAGAAVDLFDAVDTGGGIGGGDDVATSAPALPGAGSQPYDDGNFTGARNENSVLFSLDSLKGGLAAQAPKAPSFAAAPSPDILTAGPTSALTGGPSPLFSLSADQALLTAPAAPEPPPPRIVDPSGKPPPNKLFLYGGIGLGAVALLGIGLLLGRSGKEDVEPEAMAAASVEASDKAKDEKKADAEDKTDKDEKKDEKKEDEKKADAEDKTDKDEKKDEKQAASDSKTTSSGSSSSGSSKSSGSSSGSTSSGSSSSSSKDSSSSKKTEAAAPAAGTGPFSVSAAQVALTQAASNASSCKKPGGPTGVGKVQVTFATSGRVTSANVAGAPFAGTPVGGCVAGVFRRAKIPPYSGNPVTVSKSFAIK